MKVLHGKINKTEVNFAWLLLKLLQNKELGELIKNMQKKQSTDTVYNIAFFHPQIYNLT